MALPSRDQIFAFENCRCVLEVILVSEQDDKVNPAGVKGIGEVANL
jgi:hypothetical protein